MIFDYKWANNKFIASSLYRVIIIIIIFFLFYLTMMGKRKLLRIDLGIANTHEIFWFYFI